MSDETRGWDAIDAPLKALYGDVKPQHWGSIIKWRLGGPDPLDGASAYDAGDHWHYVTYGMTELYEKDSENSDISGWGFEFTFRLAKGKTTAPPVWPVSMLNNLGRYVFKSGNVFEAGHHMDANGPIALEEKTGLTALLFAHDPQLAPVKKGPLGRFEFLQVVGIHLDELNAARAWNSAGVLDELRKRSPLLVSDLSRASYVKDASFRTAVETGRKKDGASTYSLFIDRLAAKQSGLIRKTLTVTLGAIAVDSLRTVLSGRIPFGRPLLLLGSEMSLAFEPGTPGFAKTKTGWNVTLDANAANALVTTLAPKRGRYKVPGLESVEFEVVPTEIRDRKGSVVETLG